ncbi:hypothetical protein C3747_141g28 [Trypanosoma cruzi]|uniref:SPRY domain-containing protein n=2 Tax=Trypanosoma cruzi TaxID=5693 RepID=Q4DL87_TRYCC|nr:hypothetical protein, conserved [Trypanosoma cruzi]EAN93292.1 hypothetical protein, conserved [Trypanosoma cruzi]PWV04904.1 hypothetical protein C3747_141g28 [Trypanosoma cruzi]|eukprot:XP_815143.1 hypothetical protein [Trypanosoma cruzi strain CL Brener]
MNTSPHCKKEKNNKRMPETTEPSQMHSDLHGGDRRRDGTHASVVAKESLLPPHVPVSVKSPKKNTVGNSYDVSEEQVCLSPNADARGRSVVRRICAEEEAARRSRICLQQLESWKNLRVNAWRERMTLLRPEERSASLQSFSARTREDYDSSSDLPSLSDSPPCQCDPFNRTLSPPQTSGARAQRSSLLEKFYEGEVMREARRRVRREELERQTQEAAERRKAEEEKRRREREAETRRWMEEMEALRQQEREAQQRLRDELVQREEAEENARRAADRAKGAEERLESVRRAYDGAKASNKDALDGLQLRAQQVEILSTEIQRLKDATEALQHQHTLDERRQQRRIEELEHELAAASQREATASNCLRETQRELEELRQSYDEKEKAMRDVNASLRQMQRRTEDNERRLCAATSAAEEEGRRADELALQYKEAQQTMEDLRMELQRCREDATQSLKDQAARFEALIAANESAADAALRQLQTDLAAFRQRYEELRQERVAESAATEAELGAQQQEARRLHDNISELQKRIDADAAELAECRRELQEEILRNDEAERLLRKAAADISAMSAELLELQKERDGGNLRCERLEAVIRDANSQAQRARSAVSKQQPLQNQQPCINDTAALRSLFLRDGRETGLRDLPELPAHATGGHSSSAPQAGTSWLQPVESQASRRDFLARSVGHVDTSPDTRLRSLAAKVDYAVEAMLFAREYALRRPRREEEEQQQQQQQLLTSTSPLREETSRGRDRRLAAECVVKLMEAVTLLNDLLQTVEPITSGDATGVVGHEKNCRLVKRLRKQRDMLHLLLEEMRDVDTSGRRRMASAAVLRCDPLTEPLATAVAERLGTVLERLQSGEPSRTSHSTGHAGGDAGILKGDKITSFTSPSPRIPRGVKNDDDCEVAANGSATRQLYVNGGIRGPNPRHTFGFTGGRLQVSNNGTRLQRLLLPGVLDTMTVSALGALDHRTILTAQQSAAPSCFEYTIRVCMHCDGLLVGFADRYLPLEGFGPAQNSLRYTNCYYLHLGRGTLFCPAQGMVDVPYRAFQRAVPGITTNEPLSHCNNNNDGATTNTTNNNAAAVRIGEEISCSLDTVTQTIRFRRDDVDCGVAFERVSLNRSLFPAFEVNSRGCTIEFV